MGHGEAPGRGRGAKVSWSEAPLEPSLSFRVRLAMSGREAREEGVNTEHTRFNTVSILRVYSQFSQSLKSPKT